MQSLKLIKKDFLNAGEKNQALDKRKKFNEIMKKGQIFVLSIKLIMKNSKRKSKKKSREKKTSKAEKSCFFKLSSLKMRAARR